jgi:pyruvate dehydrogenase (quinone)
LLEWDVRRIYGYPGGGIRIDRPEQVGPAWDQAFRADRPFVIEAVWPAIVRQTYRDMIDGWIPHGG